MRRTPAKPIAGANTFLYTSLKGEKAMERYLTTSEARQRFLTLVEEVAGGDQIVITKRGVPKAVILNFEHLQTLKAVGRLWQDPEALRAMRESLSDVKKGRTLRLSGAPTVTKILAAARKKGLLRG
jgi:prevent-host-death family protein